MFYREAVPASDVDTQQSVLLLHGMAFKSETWLNLKTIHILAAMGHRVIAVDLPGKPLQYFLIFIVLLDSCKVCRNNLQYLILSEVRSYIY